MFPCFEYLSVTMAPRFVTAEINELLPANQTVVAYGAKQSFKRIFCCFYYDISHWHHAANGTFSAIFAVNFTPSTVIQITASIGSSKELTYLLYGFSYFN